MVPFRRSLSSVTRASQSVHIHGDKGQIYSARPAATTNIGSRQSSSHASDKHGIDGEISTLCSDFSDQFDRILQRLEETYAKAATLDAAAKQQGIINEKM
jgi:hypothetical protein